MAWRYEFFFKSPIANFFLDNIINYIEMNDCMQDFNKHSNSKKYSAFNRQFITEKYIKDAINGRKGGLFPDKVFCKIENINQYPYEIFYWENKDKL